MCYVFPSLDDRVGHTAIDHVKIHYVITSVPLGNPFTLKKREVVLFFLLLINTVCFIVYVVFSCLSNVLYGMMT